MQLNTPSFPQPPLIMNHLPVGLYLTIALALPISSKSTVPF